MPPQDEDGEGFALWYEGNPLLEFDERYDDDLQVEIHAVTAQYIRQNINLFGD
jgi:hypothetical protein